MKFYELSWEPYKKSLMVESCTGQTCANLNPKLLKVSREVSNLPNYSSCTESYGGWQCNWLSFESGCMFYKIFVKETTDKKVYKIT